MEYEIKERSLGEILDQAVLLSKNHFMMLFKISLYLTIPFSLVNAFIAVALTPDMKALQAQQEMSSESIEKLLILSVLNLIFALISLLIVIPLTNGATIYAISRQGLGKPVTSKEAFWYALRRFGKLIGTSAYAGILILLGYLALIIPGIILSFRYLFTTHVVMIEDVGGGAALERSGFLMKENYGKALILGFLLLIIGAMSGGAAGFIPGALLSSIVSVLIQSVVLIFSCAAGVVFYFSARCQHENFDLTVLSESLQENANNSTYAGE